MQKKCQTLTIHYYRILIQNIRAIITLTAWFLSGKKIYLNPQSQDMLETVNKSLFDGVQEGSVVLSKQFGCNPETCNDKFSAGPLCPCAAENEMKW